MAIDYTRSAKTLDAELMGSTGVAVVGCGGARRTAELLAHANVRRLLLIDHDYVEGRNPATQGTPYGDVGKDKVVAIREAVRAINPHTEVVPLAMRWEEAVERHADQLRTVVFLLIATDAFRVNRAARRWAIRHGIDSLDSQHYPGAACIEHAVTWLDVIARNGGCATCHTRRRLDAYEAGFTPPVDIPTNIFAAELCAVHSALIIAARLHQRAGSTLPIVGIAEAFQRRPFHLTRILPSFWAAPGEPFADAPADGQAFLSRGYALDTPVGQVCPDCGCCRSAEA